VNKRKIKNEGVNTHVYSESMGRICHYHKFLMGYSPYSIPTPISLFRIHLFTFCKYFIISIMYLLVLLYKMLREIYVFT